MDVGNIVQLNKLSSVKITENDVRRAMVHLEKAYGMVSESTPDRLRVYTGINLASCYFRLRNPMKALVVLEEVGCKDCEPFLEACVMVNLAAVKCALGMFDDALGADLKAVRILNGVEEGLNKNTALVTVYRNIAVIYMHLDKKEKATNYDIQARNLAMKHLGPSNLLTISLERSKIDYLPEKFKQKPLGSKSFLKAMRFVTGEKLQPMHNKRTPWTKRLKSLCVERESSIPSTIIRPEIITPYKENAKFSKIAVLVENIKKVILEKKGENEEASKKNLKNEEKSKTEDLKNNKHKKIKIVTSKEIEKNKKNRAALVIQKCYRGFSCRQKLMLKEFNKNIELRMDSFDMFKEVSISKDTKSEKNEEKPESTNKEYSETLKKPEDSNENLLENESNADQYSETFEEPLENPNSHSIILQEASAKLIQARFKLHLSKLALGFPVEKALPAALVIQRCFRHHHSTVNKAALKIQKTFKMYKARKVFKSVRSSVVQIQNWYRQIKIKQ